MFCRLFGPKKGKNLPVCRQIFVNLRVIMRRGCRPTAPTLFSAYITTF